MNVSTTQITMTLGTTILALQYGQDSPVMIVPFTEGVIRELRGVGVCWERFEFPPEALSEVCFGEGGTYTWRRIEPWKYGDRSMETMVEVSLKRLANGFIRCRMKAEILRVRNDNNEPYVAKIELPLWSYAEIRSVVLAQLGMIYAGAVIQAAEQAGLPEPSQALSAVLQLMQHAGPEQKLRADAICQLIEILTTDALKDQGARMKYFAGLIDTLEGYREELERFQKSGVITDQIVACLDSAGAEKHPEASTPGEIPGSEDPKNDPGTEAANDEGVPEEVPSDRETSVPTETGYSMAGGFLSPSTSTHQ